MTTPTKSMPRPFANGAPSFTYEDPTNLKRFLARMEDNYAEAGIVDDDTKKKTLGKYADQRTEEEWAALATYDSGSWTAFKKEIVNNYPEAKHAEEGSISRLNRICRAHEDIGPRDTDDLASLKRQFLTEAKKLLKPPACISNRELVEKFLGCLSNDFEDRVLSRLALEDSKPVAAAAAGAAVPPPRRGDDKYGYEDVIDMALRTAEGTSITYKVERVAGPVSRGRVASTDVVVKTELEEMKQQVVHIMDRLENTEKAQTQGFSDVMRAVLASSRAPANQNGGPRDYNRGPDPRAPQNNNLPRTEGCHYCWVNGHYIQDCPAKQAHLDQGKLKLNDAGKMRMMDGSMIPKDPQTICPRDRVEAIVESKKATQLYLNDFDDGPGVLNLESRMEPGFSIFTNSVKDTRDEVIQKLRQQVNSLQAGMTGAPAAQVSYVPHPTNQATQASTLHSLSQQMEAIQRQLAAQVTGAASTNESAQFVNTRARGGNEDSGF